MKKVEKELVAGIIVAFVLGDLVLPFVAAHLPKVMSVSAQSICTGITLTVLILAISSRLFAAEGRVAFFCQLCSGLTAFRWLTQNAYYNSEVIFVGVLLDIILLLLGFLRIRNPANSSFAKNGPRKMLDDLGIILCTILASSVYYYVAQYQFQQIERSTHACVTMAFWTTTWLLAACANSRLR